jgi:hypothetical protein
MRSRRSPGIATLTPRLPIFTCRFVTWPASSAAGMEHVHAWRIRMLASAGERAEVLSR